MEEIGQMEMVQEVLGEEQECMEFKCRGVYIRRLLEMTILIFDAEISEILIFLYQIWCFWIGIGLDWIGLELDWFWIGLGRQDKVGGYGMTNFLMK